MKQCYYDHGDRAGKWLAWQVIREDATRCIFAIRQPDIGELIHNRLLINQRFSHFYTLVSSKTMKNAFKLFDSQVIAKLLEPGAPALETSSGGAFSQRHICCHMGLHVTTCENFSPTVLTTCCILQRRTSV